MNFIERWKAAKTAKQYINILTDIDILIENAKLFKESINIDESLIEEIKLLRLNETNSFINNAINIQSFIVKMGNMLYGMELHKETEGETE